MMPAHTRSEAVVVLSAARINGQQAAHSGSLRDHGGIRHAGKPAFTQQIKSAARVAALRFSQSQGE
ncbi:hypothetical protein CU669_15300 [Paramagnetospirillum kuznetsovii]|uniref:Uncharacterized protein n=1 Tax=Paramagnetospirillum kuznetsovii TaxID=2053833 RepID=A0A364NVK7_9PROT|nr:hypothetical protein [Paramagnetospirillum kuznetsovii]RAU21118.1 hypothetical protein CU669_15300 [Paramagnetospirillum kuznetsovii]